jgi:XTP/dITP diphosphohydrolase
MKTVYLVTKNPGKLMAAKSVFNSNKINLLPVEKDYPEIQAESSLEVARFTALEAAKELSTPAIREDHSLFIHAIDFPGPFTSFMEKKIKPDILLHLLKGFEDRGGHFEVATVYAEPDGKTFEFVFQVPMTFGTEIKGENLERWDGLIRIYGEERALTEYPESERIDVWNQGYKAIAEYIEIN